MSNVVKLSTDLYLVDELLADMVKDAHEIKHLLVFYVTDNDAVSFCHTGLSLAQLAVAGKLLDKEFDEALGFNQDTE
jgi:hypothetical protein